MRDLLEPAERVGPSVSDAGSVHEKMACSRVWGIHGYALKFDLLISASPEILKSIRLFALCLAGAG